MGHQLSQIVTHAGDLGETALGSGTRVDKNSPPIEALGAVDELNSWIGVVVALAISPQVRAIFTLVQRDLFDLSAQISVPKTSLLSRAHLARVEEAFKQVSAAAAVLTESSLHSRVPSSAFAQVARSVCRRAERTLLSLTELDLPPENFGLPYLNRLSDLLLVASQLETRAADHRDAEPAKSLGDQP